MRVKNIGMLLLLACAPVWAQHDASKTHSSKSNIQKDIDPLALQVLHAAIDPIQKANGYTFRAIVGQEHPATTGQIVTLFHVSDFTIVRPNRIYADIHGAGEDVQLFSNAGHCTLFTPEVKVYMSLPCAKTTDEALNDMDRKGIFIPVRNFLASDPYTSLTSALLTAYIVGQTTLGDKPITHLAFTEPDAEWQLWVVGGEKPEVRRLEVIDKTKPGHPRTTIDFLFWNLQAKPSDDLFTFHKPEGAMQVELLKEAARK